MRISVKVIPRSSQKKIVHGDEALKVYVHESATDGKANDAVITMLSKHFDIAKSRIAIVRGEKSRNKIVEVGTRA
jgi:uncharacterized protein (TIGR00251 family)